MEKSKFVPGDLVLVNLPVPKRPSQRSGEIPPDGYWPAEITRRLPNCSRQVKCFATREVIKVPVQSIVVYNKQTIKAYLAASQVDRDSVLAQALAEIEANFVAKSRTAEEIHLSGEAKPVTSVVKSARLLETIDVGNTFMNLWNSYVENTIGKSWGMCHLPRFIEDFVKEHEEVILGEEIYKDLMLHVCSLEEVGLISSNQVKSIVEIWTELNDRYMKDGSSNVAMEYPSDASTPPLVFECPDIIDVDIDSPIEITTSALKYAFPGEDLDFFSGKSSDLGTPRQPVLSDFPNQSVDATSDITVLNITSVLKNATPEELKDTFWLNSRKRSPRSRKTSLPWLNSRMNSRTRSKGRNMPGLDSRNRSRTPSSDRNLPWLSSRRSHNRSRDRNLSGASRQTQGLTTTSRSETTPGEAEEQQTVIPFEPRVFPLSEEEYNKMVAQETCMIQECSKIVAQETPMTLECNKMITRETPITPEWNKIVAQETPLTLECNKMVAQETPMVLGCTKMISQETLVTPEGVKMVAQETPMTPTCNKQVDQETPKAPEYDKMMAQKTPKAPKYKMVAQEAPMTPECNKQVDQMVVQKTPKVLEYKAHKYRNIVNQEIIKPLPYEIVTREIPNVPEYNKLEAQKTPMVSLQPMVVDTTSSVSRDKSTDSIIGVSKDGTFAIVLDSSFEAQTSFQGGAIPAAIDYPPHVFNSTSNEIHDTSMEGIDCTFEDGNHAAIVPGNTSEAQASLLSDATPTLFNDYPSYNVDASSIVIKDTSTESTSSISGDDCHAEVTASLSEEETNFLGDATPILVIDYPTCIADATLGVINDSTNGVTEDGNIDVVSDSPYDAQTSLLGDATPVLVIDYPDYIVDATSNVTNDASKSTNIIPEDGHSTVISDSPSESQANLDVAIPALEIDYPSSSSSIVYNATSKIIIDNPTDTTNASFDNVANATSSEVLYYHPTQATTLHNHPTHATILPNHPTQTTDVLNPSNKTADLLSDPAQHVLDYPVYTNLLAPTGLLSEPAQHVLDYPVNTNLIAPTGLLSEPAQHVLDYPVNTNLLAPSEPLFAGSPCGDLLEQWWFGPRFGVYASRDMHIKKNKIPFGILEKGRNNNCNKARGEIVSSRITRNIDKNFNNKQIVGSNDETGAVKDDNEIEIIGALGSDIFVEKVLFCNSKGKQVTTETKRKRSTETVEVHKKYLMYRENGENVLHDKTDERRVHGRSHETDSSIKQSLQGCCSCCSIRTNQSGKALSSTNQDTNGNKCAVKISMNIEMSRDSFTRVSEDIPNFKAMVTQKP